MSNNIVRAKDNGLAGCHTCGRVVKLSNKTHVACPRCGCDAHYRKHDSINRAWALLISAFVMYIPANTEPIMLTTSLGQQSSDTIMSGAWSLLNAEGDKELTREAFIFKTQAVGKNYSDMVVALSKLTVQLSEQIANVIAAR